LADADDVPKRRTGLIWIVIAIGALSLVGIGLLLRSALRDTNESVSTAQTSPSPPVNGTPNPGVSPNASPNLQSVPASTIPASQNSSPAEKAAGTPQVDPVLVPTDSRRLGTSTPTPATDYAKIYSGREVDQKARVLSKPEPSYTEVARKNQITGVVVLRAVFSSSGEVTNIHAVSGLPDGLTERAMTAAKQIKFVPATKDGRPVSMWMELQYNFNLN
jgi:TonB family protein